MFLEPFNFLVVAVVVVVLVVVALVVVVVVVVVVVADGVVDVVVVAVVGVDVVGVGGCGAVGIVVVGAGDGVGDGGVGDVGDNVGKLNDKSKVPNAATTTASGVGVGGAAPGSLKISNVHSICLTHLGFDTVGGKSVFLMFDV